MGGGSAPSPDPRAGFAALMSAKTGRQYLGWMKDRAVTTDAWAAEDRARSKDVFQPLQDQFIETAKGWDSPGRQAAASREAVADVTQQATLTDGQNTRAMTAMGVDPNSRRFAAGKRASTVDLALAKVGAQNNARDQVRKQGLELEGQAINLGSGLAVNPLSSFTAGTGAISQGANGAMQGYGQQANILNQQYQGQLQAYDAEQGANGALMGALGTAAGMWYMSDEDVKERKRKVRKGGFLKAVDDMRVEKWRYKEGTPGTDGGAAEHVGTYAQDFQKATGTGDGKTIQVADAIGQTMGAVKELSAEVKDLKRRVRGSGMKAAA
jgi:hypothetical protein